MRSLRVTMLVVATARAVDVPVAVKTPKFSAVAGMVLAGGMVLASAGTGGVTDSCNENHVRHGFWC